MYGDSSACVVALDIGFALCFFSVIFAVDRDLALQDWVLLFLFCLLKEAACADDPNHLRDYVFTSFTSIARTLKGINIANSTIHARCTRCNQT